MGEGEGGRARKIAYPVYLNLTDSEWRSKIDKGYEILKSCILCGRRCEVNRIKGEKGECRSDWQVIISSYHLHFGEEPPISGRRGSGTVFFTNCSMHCQYCQNYTISQLGMGDSVTIDGLTHCFLYLQDKGAHNINLVTPTHFVPQIIAATWRAVKRGLRIPIVYNTGGYDSIETLKLMDGIVDIYMPDAKYGDNDRGLKYSKVTNYVDVNQAALREMHRQVGDLVLEDGVAVRGLMVRHLVLPNDVSNTEKVLKFLHELSPNLYLSLMSQYYPSYKADECRELSRSITSWEYDKALELAKKLGFRGYFQPYMRLIYRI